MRVFHGHRALLSLICCKKDIIKRTKKLTIMLSQKEVKFVRMTVLLDN